MDDHHTIAAHARSALHATHHMHPATQAYLFAPPKHLSIRVYVDGDADTPSALTAKVPKGPARLRSIVGTQSIYGAPRLSIDHEDTTPKSTLGTCIRAER
jgi:hypothetical protein